MISKANISAYGSVFGWAAFIVVLGGISAFFLKDHPVMMQRRT